MLKRLLLFSMTAAAMASATPLVVNVSGQFANTDVADQFVSPNGHFSLSFVFNTPVLPAAVTSLGFDIPLTSVSYTLNGSTNTIVPSEIRFNTAANGGLFDVIFGTGLTAAEFDFQGAQAFTGTTAAPVFAPGTLSVSGWTFSDPANYDSQSSATATIALTPEPASVCSMLAGLVLVGVAGIRNARQKR